MHHHNYTGLGYYLAPQAAGPSSHPPACSGYQAHCCGHYASGQPCQSTQGSRHKPWSYRPYYVPARNCGCMSIPSVSHPRQPYHWPEMPSAVGPWYGESVGYRDRYSPGGSGGSACSSSPPSDPALDGGDSQLQQLNGSPVLNVVSTLEQVVSPAPTRRLRRKTQKIQQVCTVCSRPATGYHYNAVSCEGCKGFFRRIVRSKKQYICVGGGRSTKEICANVVNPNGCKACRLQLCIKAGMDVSLVQARGMKIDELPAAASRPAAHCQAQVKLMEHQVVQPRPAEDELIQFRWGHEGACLTHYNKQDSPLLRALLNAPPLVPLVVVDLATLCGPVEHGLQGRDAKRSATQVQSTAQTGLQERDPQELDREPAPLPPFSELLSHMLDTTPLG